MAEPIKSKLRRSLQTAEGLYHRLVLLVGETRSGKTEVLHGIAADLGTNVINVNLALSRELLELTARQRALHLLEILDRLLGTTQPTVVLDNLEILFDKEMRQDPLRVLQGISRNRGELAGATALENPPKDAARVSCAAGKAGRARATLKKPRDALSIRHFG